MNSRSAAHLLAALWFLALFAMAAKVSAQDNQLYPDKIGVDLDGLGDGDRGKPMVDIARTLRGWTQVSGTSPAPLDEHGWPTSDAATVLFDVRPFPAWSPPIDDPAAFQADWSGTYKMSFQGQAVIELREDKNLQVLNQSYDPATNLTTADLVVPKGVGLLSISFTQTKRAAEAPAGSGITRLRVIIPGYPADSTALFTHEFLRALKPFAVLRFMDWQETNNNPGFYGDPGHHALNLGGSARPRRRHPGGIRKEIWRGLGVCDRTRQANRQGHLDQHSHRGHGRLRQKSRPIVEGATASHLQDLH